LRTSWAIDDSRGVADQGLKIPSIGTIGERPSDVYTLTICSNEETL
jgi:hypothetical protein